jgi:predicted ATPase
MADLATGAEGRRLYVLARLAKTFRPYPWALACFRHARNSSRAWQAKVLELQAAMILIRLWQQQGKRAEALELLAPIYGWFTEAFDTADLQEAKALLDELS